MGKSRNLSSESESLKELATRNRELSRELKKALKKIEKLEGMISNFSSESGEEETPKKGKMVDIDKEGKDNCPKCGHQLVLTHIPALKKYVRKCLDCSFRDSIKEEDR